MSNKGKTSSSLNIRYLPWVFFWGFGVVLPLAGLFLGFSDIKGGLMAHFSTFKTTTGTVIHSSVIRVPSPGGRGRYTPRFKPVIAYKYQVKNQSYTSDIINYDGETNSTNWENAHRWVQSHPVGSKIQVHYRVADPSFAVLEPDANHGLYEWFFFSASMATFTFLFAWFGKWLFKDEIQNS